MQFNPLVSIVIPVYNGSNFLKKAIDSALSQTYKNIEIIVVNDGSTDGGETEKIALSYGEKIRYFNKENGGVSTALNLGIRKMKGEYFSWLSHDDEYTPTKVEEQINRVKCGADIIMCSNRQIDVHSHFLSRATDYRELGERSIVSWNEVLSILLNGDSFYGCSLLIPKIVFDDIGFFNEELRYNQDYDMWLRICFGGYSWHFHNDACVLARVHNNQTTQTRRELFYSDSYKLGLQVIPILSKSSSIDDNYLLMYAKRCGKYNLKKNVALCRKTLKEKKLLSVSQNILLTITCLYGQIRPIIRRAYYMCFKRVKTQ